MSAFNYLQQISVLNTPSRRVGHVIEGKNLTSLCRTTQPPGCCLGEAGGVHPDDRSQGQLGSGPHP